MFNFKEENSYIYNSSLRILQVITALLLLVALALNNRLENISDILRNISITLQLFILTIIGIKGLVRKKNKVLAYLNFGIVFIVLIFIMYINFLN